MHRHAIQSDIFVRIRFGDENIVFERRTTNDIHRRRGPTSPSFSRSRPFALFTRRETSRRASFARISSEKISDSPDGSWMDENRRRDGGGARPRERNGTALRNFTRRRPTGRQTRAMDEMLTRRETIDYSRQDRSRQVGREMAFLYQSGLRHRFCATLIEIHETHLFSGLRYGTKKSQESPESNLS